MDRFNIEYCCNQRAKSLLRAFTTSEIWCVTLSAIEIDRTEASIGSVVRIAPNQVSTTDLSATRTVYKVGSHYMKSQWYRDFAGVKEEQSLFTMTDPQKHAHHRRIQSANFADRWMQTLEPYVRSTIQQAVNKIEDEVRTEGITDVYKWFTFMVTITLHGMRASH